MISLEYHEGKRKPYRSFYEWNGAKKYVGYFATEYDAWIAAAHALQAKRAKQKIVLTEAAYVEALTDGAGAIR